jgi:hypothetical protein
MQDSQQNAIKQRQMEHEKYLIKWDLFQWYKND